MLWVQRFWLRLQTLFGRNRSAERLDDEIQFHLEHQIAENIAAGMSWEEARHAALRTFGNPTFLKGETRDTWGWIWLEQVGQDLRHVARMLCKNPGFTAVAVLTLALGIGANTAVFSLIDALLLRSLAVPAPSELVRISFGPPGTTGAGLTRPLSGPMFDRLRERQSAFTDLFGWTNAPMVLTEKGVTRPIQAAYATGSTFPTLRLRPRLGRLLEWQDDEPSASSNGLAAVVSEAFWIEHFGGDASVLGQPITVNGIQATIVGVMPR